jgi:hypothetical protein
MSVGLNYSILNIDNNFEMVYVGAEMCIILSILFCRLLLANEIDSCNFVHHAESRLFHFRLKSMNDKELCRYELKSIIESVIHERFYDFG